MLITMALEKTNRMNLINLEVILHFTSMKDEVVPAEENSLVFMNNYVRLGGIRLSRLLSVNSWAGPWNFQNLSFMFSFAMISKRKSFGLNLSGKTKMVFPLELSSIHPFHKEGSRRDPSLNWFTQCDVSIYPHVVPSLPPSNRALTLWVITRFDRLPLLHSSIAESPFPQIN